MINKEIYTFKTEQMLKYRKSFINYLKQDNVSNDKIYAILSHLDNIIIKELDITKDLNDIKLKDLSKEIPYV